MRSSLQGAVAAMSLAIGGVAQAGEPVNNYQNSVAIRFSMVDSGPMRGSIFMFAGNFDPFGTRATDGAYVSISSDPELFTLIGTSFGGDAMTNFQLPNLIGRTPFGPSSTNPVGTTIGTAAYQVTGAEMPVSLGGGGAPLQNMQPSLAMNAIVAATGATSSSTFGGAVDYPYVGQILYTAATPWAHNIRSNTEFLWADGGSASNSEYGDLHDALGDTYGASTPSNFTLPDLSDRVAFGDGTGAGIGTLSGSNEMYLQPVHIPSAVFDGAPYSNKQAGISMRYLICVDGEFSFSPFPGPPRPGDISEGILGQIILYSGDGPIPEGWILADGSLLSISGNEELFYVMGIAYGGNGTTNFAIPDLVNYIPIGAGGDIQTGQKFGTNFTALTPNQIPEPGTCVLLGLGLTGLFVARRRRGEG